MQLTKPYSGLFLLLFSFAIWSSCKEDDATVTPAIRKITPLTGKPGDLVTIEGMNFGTDENEVQVKFNGVLAAITKATTSEIKVTVPEGVSTGKVSVKVGEQTVVYDEDFVVTEEEIQLTYCTPIPQGQIIDSAPRLGWTQFKISGTNSYVLHNDFNGIDDPEAGSSATHYYDLNESHHATFTTGQQYTLDLLQSMWKWTKVDAYFKAWIDYNENGLFESTEIIASTVTPTKDLQSFDLTIPGGLQGNTGRIRIIVSDNIIQDPCALPIHGEVVDYSMSIE